MINDNDLNRNSLVIISNASFSLNYLVFMQNVFENSNSKDNPRPLFPYVDSSRWGILQSEEFEKIYKEMWNEAVSRNMNNHIFDHGGILELEKSFFQRLFQDNENGRLGYSESVKLFLSWWAGFHGKMAVERVCEDNISNIYRELSQSIEPTYDMTANRQLRIELIYDQQRLADTTATSWYSVLSIEDIILNKPELVMDLLKCCEDI